MNLLSRVSDVPGRRRGELLQLWHEQGADREVLLPMLETALLREGCRVIRDDGWREYDLRLRRGRWVVGDLLTVTEYHEDGATLTRFRLTLRPTRFAVAITCVMGAVLVAVTACPGAGLPLLLLAAGWAMLYGMWMASEMAGIRGLCGRVTEDVGRSAGAAVMRPASKRAGK